ncbi:MAG: histidine triad nucleotide-binding protein [Parachlamydiaceae bacterium]|nr:histidine triad nucleotide-binding protein [Parachlamydiaceae bacterium]
MTIFGKIIAKEIPADIVFENERIIAFKDIHPAAPVHLLIMPKKEIIDMQSLQPEDYPVIAEIVEVAQQLAVEFNIANGYRFLTNNGPLGGQVIFHLHFHLMGGGQLGPINA